MERAEEWASFESKNPSVVRGRLYRFTPVTLDQRERVERYVRDAMPLDLEYTRLLYGRVRAAVNSYDFEFFWESPWVEEHIRDSNKRRRVEEAQKSLAVRSYIRASATTAQDPGDVDQFLRRVDRVTRWEDKEDNARDLVKTISRVVQSYERKALRDLLPLFHPSRLRRPLAHQMLCHFAGGASPLCKVPEIAHALRRNPSTMDIFANLVGTEILVAHGTGGSQNTSIHLSKCLRAERDNAVLQLVDALEQISPRDAAPDTIGLPLMDVNCSLCVSAHRGVLVVSGGADCVSYVLDIEEDDLSPGGLDLTSVKEIQIADVYTEEQDRDLVAARRAQIGKRPETPPQAPEPAAAKTVPLLSSPALLGS